MDTKNKTSNENFNATSHKTDVISSALPCPFCGGKDLQFISDVDGDREVEFIVCMNNDCLCDGRIGKNKEEALSRWNSRHCL